MIPETKEDILKLAEIEQNDKLLKAMDDYAEICVNKRIEWWGLFCGICIGVTLGLILSHITIKL